MHADPGLQRLVAAWPTLAPDVRAAILALLPPGSSQVPAIFCCWQPGFGQHPTVALWTLTQDIPGHPRDSTVTTATLHAAGYMVHEPAVPEPATAQPTTYLPGPGDAPGVLALGMSGQGEGR